VSLEGALGNAISGLNTSKSTIQVISNNIANVNTEGYSRKIVNPTSRNLDGVGFGVEIGTIGRTVDQGVLKQVRVESGKFEKLSVKDNFLSQINNFFGRPADNNSISHKIAELGAQFDALAITPETSPNQSLAVNAAEDITRELARLSEQVQSMRLLASNQIKDAISDINAKMQIVVDTNLEIVNFGNNNRSTAELEDQRDIAINEIAKQIDITYFQRSSGAITLFTKEGKTLLDGRAQTLSYDGPTSMNAVLEYVPTTAENYLVPGAANFPAEGVPGIFIGTPATLSDITSDINNGAIKGLIDLRDTDLPALQGQLDELADKIKSHLNKAHNKGTGFPPPTSLVGDNFITTATSLANASGKVLIGVVDASGNLVEREFIDLSNANITSVATLLTNGANAGINDKFTNLTASVNSDGNLSLVASGSNRVTINEFTSSVSGANKPDSGFSDFFGLNNLYVSTESFNTYRSSAVKSKTSALITTGGTVQFTTSGGNTSSVNYTANDTLDNLKTKLTAATGITATIISDGSEFRLQLTEDSGNNFAVVETGSGTLLTETGLRNDYRGISNRVKVRSDISSNNFNLASGKLQSSTFSSENQTSSSSTFAALGKSAGTLAFTIDSSTTASINYATGDSLTTLAAAINSNATLSTAQISAEVIASGSNFNLKITDAGSQNFLITDSGGLAVATSQGLSIGNGDNAIELAAAFNDNITFLEAPARGGGLSQTTTTINNYASNILSAHSVEVAANERDLQFQESLTLELSNQHGSISGVNMDEELASMIVIEQSYLAASRIISTVQELFQILSNMMD